MLENGMIRLQFESGQIDLTPGEAQALVSDTRLHNEIRRAVLAARKQLTLGAKPPGETLTDMRSL